MKGLVKYNFYLSRQQFFMMILSAFIIGVLITFLHNSNISMQDILIPVLLIMQCTIFSNISGDIYISSKKNNWIKLKSTLPLKSQEIILAEYSLQFLYSLTGIIICAITIFSANLHPILKEINYFSIISIAIIFLFFRPAFLNPISLKSPHRTADTLFLFLIIILGFVFAFLLGLFLDNLKIALAIFFILGLVAFITSYFISVKLYRKSEIT